VKLADLAPDRASLERLEARFWSKVDVRGEDECWPWEAGRYSAGYGSFAVTHTLSRGAHRVAYVLFCGHIDDGLLVCHDCDNPPCCNPAHLFAGTTGDNARDRTEKGRSIGNSVSSGCRHFRSTLGPHDVAEIRRVREEVGLSYRKLAAAFGVSNCTISNLLNGRTYRDV
jgi:DNA-binding XRE family transcriptional regulator